MNATQNPGKGWHGDRPGHVAASVRKSIEGTLRNQMVKSPIALPNKSLDYKTEDFNIIRGKDTGDPRIPFAFESKDGKISANFFWYNEGVFLRSIVGDTGILEIRYPLVHSSNSGYNLPPFQKVLHGLIVALKRGNYQGEFTDNTFGFEKKLKPWQMTLEEYWASKFNGLVGDSFSKENIKIELRGKKELLEDVKSGKTRPNRIVGTGYKYPKKAAIEWLEAKITELQNIVDGKAMDKIAVSNHAFHVREAIKAGKPVPSHVLAQYPNLKRGNHGNI